MSTGRRLAGAAVCFVAIKCAVLATNAACFPVLGPSRRARQPATQPRVSILIPARDEASNLRSTLPACAAQAGVDEILVVDDGSRDETADVVRDIARDDHRVQLLTGSPLPPGWVGKTWACHQLAEAATGDMMIFCDADVRLAPGAVAAIVAEADRQHAVVFSVFPQQRTGSLGERLLVPLIDDVLLCFLPHRLLDEPVPLAATANGQLLVFRRDAYEQLGGHAAVRAAIVEDVRLALRTRRAGLRLGLALGGDVVSTRMYRGYSATVAGFTKSLRAAHGGSRLLLMATSAWHLAAYTMPWLRLAGVAGRPQTNAEHSLWVIAAALGLLERAGVNALTGRRSFWEVALVPVAPVAALPVTARAMRRTKVWKGRRYT